MLFSHDTERALACAVDLVNNASVGTDTEPVGDLASLAGFVARHDVSEVGRLGRHDLEAMNGLRDALRGVFGAPDEQSAAARINELVGRAAVMPRLTDHDHYSWHIHYFTPEATLAEHLSIDCGMALAQVVAAGEWERLRTCDAPACDQVLLDLSRNRSKRYCDARTCGNRLHVAAYRERQRSAAPS